MFTKPAPFVNIFLRAYFLKRRLDVRAFSKRSKEQDRNKKAKMGLLSRIKPLKNC